MIAEGVETEGQLLRLRGFGCDEVQGNLISPPVSAEALEQSCFAAADRRDTARGRAGSRAGAPARAEG